MVSASGEPQRTESSFIDDRDTLSAAVITLHDQGDADGRSLRRLRNREHVLMTVLGLIRAGDSDPSVQAIADGAGVSLRSIFRYFDDLDNLLCAAVELGVQQAMPLSVIPNAGEGALELRIDTYVDTRLRLYGASHEFGRIARNRSDAIPALARTIRGIQDLMRCQARAQFEPELERLDPVDAEFTLDAVTLMTGFGAYDTERRLMGHGPERIRIVWKRNLAAQLSAG
ncbi:MAG: TetR/AcrR family transcriptional regulator [Ilumatobacter sp.]|nr:TetR/AcrR family transcriptional regulator [Ilumatobacter sp.]